MSIYDYTRPLTDEQYHFIAKLLNKDIPTAMEEVGITPVTLLRWQRLPLFRSLMREMQALIKQSIAHRTLLEAEEMLDDISAQSEHITIRERIRTLENITGIIKDIDIEQKEVLSSWAQSNAYDATCWRKHLQQEETHEKNRQFWEKVEQEEEQKKRQLDPSTPQDTTLKAIEEDEYEDDDDDYGEDDVEPEDQGHDHNLDQEQSVAPLPFRGGAGGEVSPLPELGEGQGVRANGAMEYAQDQVNNTAPSPNTSAFSAPSAVQEDIQEERRPRYGEMYCGHLWDVPDPEPPKHSGILSGGRRTFRITDDPWETIKMM